MLLLLAVVWLLDSRTADPAAAPAASASPLHTALPDAGQGVSPSPAPTPVRSAPPEPAASVSPDASPDASASLPPVAETPTPTPTPKPTPAPKPSPEPTPAPTVSAAPAEPSAPIPETCSLTVRCDDILQHMDRLAKGKESLVPADGVLLNAPEAELQPGDTVLDVLLRELRIHGVHVSYVGSTAYGTAYVEGIGNLYEFDCGPTSGWTYYVNGNFPGVGCSAYALAPGDRIEFVYSCEWTGQLS